MTNTETYTLEVANEIHRQLGHKALYMIGAKNFLGSENGLTFRIMKNAKKVKWIRITLTSLDLYFVEFIGMKKSMPINIAEFDGVYNDQLHKLIETNTELYTSL